MKKMSQLSSYTILTGNFNLREMSNKMNFSEYFLRASLESIMLMTIFRNVQERKIEREDQNRWESRHDIIGLKNLLGSCRQGEGAPDNVEHVERPDSISWKCDTQQDAPCPSGAPCPSCFPPGLLSRSGKSLFRRRNPWKHFFYRPFSSK